MEKVTYIIPIHKYDDSVETYLTRALLSLNAAEGTDDCVVMFVGPRDVLGNCKKLYEKLRCKQKIDIAETKEEDLFAKLNYAAKNCVTSYFSVLEFDDAYYPYWNNSVQKILQKERHSVILPINELYSNEGKPVGLMNEIAWDAAFADELGFLNIEELRVFKDFNVTGGYIKTNDFIAIGGLKPSMKIATWYEFLLRMINNGKKVFVLPRIGYKHTVLREDSYMVNTAKEIPQKEGVWLINYALEDYVNKKDSKKEFKNNQQSIQEDTSEA